MGKNPLARTKIPCAWEQLSLCVTTTKPSSPGPRAPHGEKPLQRGACAKNGPCSLQLESARASNGDPAQPKHTTVPLSSCTFPSQNSATSSSRSNPELTSLPGSSPDMLVSSLAPDLGPHTCCSHSPDGSSRSCGLFPGNSETQNTPVSAHTSPPQDASADNFF